MKVLPPTKAQLRDIFLKKRMCLPLGEYRMRCICLVERAMAACRRFRPAAVHLFLTCPRRQEPDMWPLVHLLWQAGIPTLTMTKQASAVLFDAATPLQKNAWGMLEPACASPEAPPSAPLCFVPLLLFDKEGYRLGYGKGIYDRFLAMHPHMLSIGLSLSPPIAVLPERAAYDQPMDACLTPWKAYRFREGRADFV